MDRLKKNYILNTASQALRLLTPLLVTPHISRALGADGVGIFSYTYSVQYYFALFAVLGTSAYGAREIARVQNDKKTASHLFWEIWLLTATTSLISIAAWGVLILTSGEYKLYYTILTLYILGAMLDISWFYTGLEKFTKIVYKNIIIRILEVALILILIKDAGDIWLYCLIMGGGTFVGNAALWFGIGKELEKTDRKQLRPYGHLKNTLVYFLPTIATSIYTVLDKTLIGLITQENAQNGYYEQATKIINVVKSVVFVSLNMVLSPRCANLYVNGKFDEIKEKLRSSVEFMFMLGIASAFGIAGVADIFVPWFFGDGYEEVAVLLKLLSPIIVIITISNALGYQYYDPAGLRAKSSGYLIIGAGVNLVLNIMFIPSMKSRGAIIASLIAEGVISALYLKNCDGYLYFRDIINASRKKLISGGVMFVCLSFMQKKFIPSTVDMLILVCLGAMVYFICLLLLRDKMFVSLTKQITSRIMGKIKNKRSKDNEN